MIGEIGAIGHAGITTIKTTSLAIRNFETEPFNGNQRNRHTGKTDAIYFADVMEAVNEKAGKHSTVLRNLQFIFMDQQQLDLLASKRFARSHYCQRSSCNISEIFRLSADFRFRPNFGPRIISVGRISGCRPKSSDSNMFLSRSLRIICHAYEN